MAMEEQIEKYKQLKLSQRLAIAANRLQVTSSFITINVSSLTIDLINCSDAMSFCCGKFTRSFTAHGSEAGHAAHSYDAESFFWNLR
jgi:hypothetical protein